MDNVTRFFRVKTNFTKSIGMFPLIRDRKDGRLSDKAALFRLLKGSDGNNQTVVDYCDKTSWTLDDHYQVLSFTIGRILKNHKGELSERAIARFESFYKTPEQIAKYELEKPKTEYSPLSVV